MELVSRPVVLAIAACSCAVAALARPSAPPGPPATRPSAATQPSGDNRRDRAAEIIASAVDKAHGGAQFRMRSILQCDLALDAGERSLQGTLTMQTNDIATRLDLSDGASLVFDGSTCWVSPQASTIPEGAAVKRLLAWRALVAAPFMARDSHVKVSFYRAAMVMGADVDGFRVDWRFGEHMPPQTLMAYADARKRELSVIGGDTLGELLGFAGGDKTVRSVVYTDFQNIEGMLLPMTWWLYDWSEAAGVRGERLGTVKISNVRFLRVDQADFSAPNGARPDRPLPSP